MRLYHLHLATIGFMGVGEGIFAIPVLVPEVIIVDIHSSQKEPVYKNKQNIIRIVRYEALASPLIVTPKKVTTTQTHRTWMTLTCPACCKPNKRPPETRARSPGVSVVSISSK